MYKEVISRKRLPLLILILFAVTILLYIKEFLYMNKTISGNIGHIINIIFLIIMIILIVIEIRLMQISYKYSLIANKLIINRLYRNKQINLISLKVDNIIYFGEKGNLPVEYKQVHIQNRYCCNLINKHTSVCIFKDENELKGFYFDASTKLKNKIIENRE